MTHPTEETPWYYELKNIEQLHGIEVRQTVELLLHKVSKESEGRLADREKTMQEWDKRRLDILAMTRRETIENAIDYIEDRGFPSIGLRQYLESLTPEESHLDNIADQSRG